MSVSKLGKMFIRSKAVEKVPDDAAAVAGGAVVVGEVGNDVEASAVVVEVELKWQHLEQQESPALY